MFFNVQNITKFELDRTYRLLCDNDNVMNNKQILDTDKLNVKQRIM